MSEVNWTTDPVDLPGVEPTAPPTELVLDRLWQGGCPVDFRWARDAGIDVVLDVSDADSYPPAAEIEGLIYLKSPLVDHGTLPDEGLIRRLAQLVAGLIEDGHRALVHCTFGRNRSGLMAALIVRELLGVSGAEALAHVRALRDGVVNNDVFSAWLEGLPAPGRTATDAARDRAHDRATL